jgi:hypothetical protein
MEIYAINHNSNNSYFKHVPSKYLPSKYVPTTYLRRLQIIKMEKK